MRASAIRAKPGRAIQFGLTYNPKARALFYGGFFDLTKTNVLTRMIRGAPLFRQTGEVHSRGWSWKERCRWQRPGLVFIHLYDIKVTKSDDVDLGKRPIVYPSTWLPDGLITWALDFLHGLGFGVGVLTLDRDIMIWKT